ncbi:MAG TPA: c-type cytochrome biogenesis protein CcmI [Burkholderiales bacterium]|nr:c-type cytochrome biogenesis protein CcmI [Burkholderiales bacterium]
MLVFWLLAGVLLAVVVAILLYPLLSRRELAGVSRNAANAALYTEQMRELEADLRSGAIGARDFESATSELKARLLADTGEAEAPRSIRGARGAAIAVGAAIPLLSVGIYLAIGSPQVLGPVPAADPAHQLSTEQIEKMVERLAERLKSDPGNVEGWQLLGRSYTAFGRFKESSEAYANAAKLRPDDAQLLADYADALGMALGRKLEGEPEKLIARALEIDPRNLKALALAGTGAYERKDYKGAAAYWERMLPLVEPDSDDARSIRANVEEARSLTGGSVPQKTAADAPAPAASAAAPSARLRGEVRLAPALAEKVSPTDTVFIFARAAQGPPMPLAVLRKQVRDLPVAFALDDSMAMSPAMMLSGFAQVVVGARVSKSGDVAAKPGDLQGQSAPVASNANGVAVVIDSVVR